MTCTALLSPGDPSAMALPLALPAPGSGTVEDQAEFSALSRAEQDRVRRWQLHLDECRRAAHGTRGRLMATIARREDCSLQTVRGKYDRWLAEGWRALINRSVHRAPTVPAATVQFMTGLVESHQRGTVVRQAHRTLLARLDAWEADGGLPSSQHAIPGYHSAPRRNRSTGLPPGWDYTNMAKLVKRWREDAARKQGPKAHASTLPSVLGSRLGCAVGQILFFDDEVAELYVNFTGNNGPMRPLGFHCLDFVSGCNIHRGFKPVIQDGNSRRTVASQLTKADFDWFLLSVLTRYGYNPHTGTTLVGEMGTAAASTGLVSRLHDTFGGKVQWDHSGRYGEPLRGMIYEGQSCGNFRYKAPIESWFNILRNHGSALPGNAGRNRDMAPEENHGLLRENARYLRLLEQLPPERRALLRPEGDIFHWDQFCQVMNDLIELINRRTDHSLGQWDKMGFLQLAMFDSMAPTLIERVREDENLLRAMAAADPRLRRLSPREVWDRHAPRQLRPLTPMQIVTLMGMEAAREVKVNAQHDIVIQDREIDSEPLHYTALHCVNALGDHLTLRPGETYLAFLNPYAPHEIHLCRATATLRGSYLGTCHRREATSRADAEGLISQYGQLQSAVTPLRHDIEHRAAPEISRRQAIRSHNRRVEDLTRPLTPAEKAAAASRHALTGAFAPEPGETAALPPPPPAADPFAAFAD